MFTTQSKRSKLFHNIVMVSRRVILHSSFVECNHFYSTTILCVTRNLTASVWTSDTERSAHSPAPVPPSEMLLSVEPVMLTKAPRDPTQEEPQPSTSTSHFCIGSPATPGPMATTARPASGRFSLLTHGCGGWFVVLRGRTFFASGNSQCITFLCIPFYTSILWSSITASLSSFGYISFWRRLRWLSGNCMVMIIRPRPKSDFFQPERVWHTCWLSPPKSLPWLWLTEPFSSSLPNFKDSSVF